MSFGAVHERERADAVVAHTCERLLARRRSVPVDVELLGRLLDRLERRERQEPEPVAPGVGRAVRREPARRVWVLVRLRRLDALREREVRALLVLDGPRGVEAERVGGRCAPMFD